MLHRTTEVEAGVHVYVWVGRGINANSILLTNALAEAQPHVLIDPGMAEGAMRERALASLIEAMARDGFKLDDVGLVIGTHSHPDHFQAIDEVVRRTGARVALSLPEYRFLRGGGSWFYDSFATAVPSCEPSVLLQDGQVIPGCNGWRLEVLMTPGHSPGSVCLYIPDSRVLVTGDVVLPGNVGPMNLVGGSAREMQDSIVRLMELDVEHILPGHSRASAPVITGRDSVVRNFQTIRRLFQGSRVVA